MRSNSRIFPSPPRQIYMCINTRQHQCITTTKTKQKQITTPCTRRRRRRRRRILKSRHQRKTLIMLSSGRLLRVSRPLRLTLPNSISSNGSSTFKCLSKAEMMTTTEKGVSWNGEKKSKMAVEASVAVSETLVVSTDSQTKNGVDLSYLVSYFAKTAVKISRFTVKRRSWKQQIQMMIEKGLIDCRFFTLLAVGGSLLGSVLCFVEGCFFILASYFEYFHTISQRTNQGHVMQLLIEAIDMYLIGCAMLMFGMGLYVQFVGSRTVKRENRILLPGSNFFGLYVLEKLPACVGMQSVSQAKSRIGHAMVMILQVGVLEKFKSVPLVTGFDLACFAGAVLISSACVFLLSKLAMDGSD